MSAPAVLILADDVTGMADCAARCRQAGMPATIWLRVPERPRLRGAVAFTSDSRRLSPAEAAARVRSVLTQLTRVTGAIWYKKIDSTLRGNLGAELDAMLDALDENGAPLCAVISPAFPAQQRGIEQGYLVHAGTPPRTVHLPSLLSGQSRRKVAAINLEVVRAGVAECASVLRGERAAGAELLAVDALTDADLEVMLAAVQEGLPGTLLCGSAGLVGVLARYLARTQPTAGMTEASCLPVPGPVVVVVGSGSRMAWRQIEYLTAYHPVRRVKVTAGGRKGPTPEDGIEGDWLVHLPEPTADTRLEGPGARAMAERLADEVANLVATLPRAVLILVGGDTAMSALHRLGVERLDVVCELQPGMPLATGPGTDGREVTVVLKAGNHGTEATLAKLVETLLGGQADGH